MKTQSEEFVKLCNSLTLLQRHFLLELIFQLENCETKRGLSQCIESLQNLFSFSVYSTTGVELSQRLGMTDQFCNVINYPKEFVQHYLENKWQFCDPVVMANFKRGGFSAQRWTETYPFYKSQKSKLVIEHSNNWNVLKDGLAFGFKGNELPYRGALFCFAGDIDFSIAERERTERIMNFLMPFFFRVIEKILKKENRKLLSPIQRKILKCVQQGMERPEIVEKLEITPSNLKYHTNQIFEKLGVSTRASAVSTAILKGIL